MTEAKKWLVRSWDGGVDTDLEARRLEDVLNELSSNDYRVHKLDLKRRLVTAYAGPPPGVSLLTALFGDRPTPTTGTTDTPMREDVKAPPSEEEEGESELNYVPKGKLTPHLVDRLTYVMVAHSKGDNHTREHVCDIVKTLFSKESRHEAECSLTDMQAYHRLHIKKVTDTGGKCSCTSSCSTHSVLEVVKKVLEEHLSSNPAS